MVALRNWSKSACSPQKEALSDLKEWFLQLLIRSVSRLMRLPTTWHFACLFKGLIGGGLHITFRFLVRQLGASHETFCWRRPILRFSMKLIVIFCFRLWLHRRERVYDRELVRRIGTPGY